MEFNINKYNYIGYLNAFNEDILDEIVSLELFRFLINTNYINGLDDRYQEAAQSLVENKYLTFDGKQFVINKSKLTNLN